MDLEITFDIRFDIIFGTWDYLLNVVGVALFGLPRGRVVVLFTLTIEIHPLFSWLEFFIYIFFHSILCIMMDGYIFMMDGYIFMVDDFYLLYCICFMDPKRMM